MGGSFVWPNNGGSGVQTYANLAAFPAAATAGNGALGIALDTNILYESTGSAWVAIAAPGDALTLGAFGSTPNANGLSLSAGGALNMQPSDATHPGGLLAADWVTFNAKASATLSNLGTTAVNADINPSTGASGTLKLGASTKTWGAAFISVLGDGSNNTSIDAFGRQLDNAGTGIMLDWSGATVDFQSREISSVADPTSAQHAATKHYVDTNAANVTLSAFGSTPNSTGASLSGQALTLQPADGTNGGGVSTAAQTFAGAKTFSSTIVGSINGNAATATTATTATNATNETVTDDTTTNATMYPAWFTAATGNLPAKVSSTKLTFNPSTAALSATTFSGALSGNATTATTATNATNTAITEDTSTNATMYPTWVTANTGNIPQKTTSTKLSFNPSTGLLAATTFSGAGTSLTGTAASLTAGTANAVAANSVANAGLAQMAAHTYKGNNTGSTANALDLTQTQLTAELNAFTTSLQGVVPSSGGGTTNFLRADGTWTAPAGSGTVTSAAMTVPAGLAVSGSPITTSGTFAITASGNFAASQMPAFTGDITTSAGAVATTAAATQANIVTLSKSTGVAVHGTNTNDNAAAGYVGEYIESTVTSLTAMTALSNHYQDATNIVLTAGDWDITFMVDYESEASASITFALAAITTTTGDSATGITYGTNALQEDRTTGLPTGDNLSIVIPAYRQAISGSTTFYGKLFATYATTAPKFRCRLSARRMR